ncbi:hypothetical protein DJ83_14505 [Halorubrum ezzemoulense]|uniref:Uncharacterized protein n=1 Tax=Halorubrum ezzemoulense TaxID=337243 RepID=A0A256IQN5_HALEZ|nr:hypothetical protein DJ83_14505 [Halorubrum ezzemoulense]
MEALADEVENQGFFGYEGELRGAEDFVTGEDYIFLDFYKEITVEQEEFNEDADIVMGERELARPMRFLLTEDGKYAFESTSQVYDDDALEYLFEPFGLDFETEQYGNFSLEEIKNYYENVFRVRGLKLKGIAEQEPERHHDTAVEDLVQQAGEPMVRAVFSTGSKDNNLKNSDIVDGFSDLSDIKYIRAKDSEGEIQELYSSGRIEVRYSADFDLEDQAQLARDTMETVFSSYVG